MNPLVLTRTLAVVLLTGASVWLTAPSAPAAPLDPPGSKKAPAMALVVVQQSYLQPLGELADATLHAAQLAGQLRRAGYFVVLVADGPLADDAKAALDGGEKVPKGPAVDVRRAATADTLQKEINSWTDEAAKKEPTLALVVLSGYGEEREKEPFLWTIGDAPGKGGVSLAALGRDASKKGKKGLYAAVVCDICRPPSAMPVGNDVPAPDEDRSGNYDYLKRRDGGLDVPVALRPDGVAPDTLLPTTLYSVRGDKAGKGLTHYLAEALRDPKAVDKSLELMAPGQKKTELRLSDWARFAVVQVQAQQGRQSHRFAVGDVPTTQPVVTRGPGNLGGPSFRDYHIDLLAAPLSKDLGEFELKHDPRLGLTITRPKNIASPWAGCQIPSDGGIDPTGKSLVLDVVADAADKPVGDLLVSVNPFARPAGRAYLNLYNRQNKDSDLLAIPYSSPRRITLPLQSIPDIGGKPHTLDSLGWASAAVNSERAWPPGATLTVFAMSLVGQGPNPPKNPQPLDLGDLLTDSWRGGGGFRGEGVLQLAAPKDGQKAQFQLVPQAGFVGKSRRGGDIFPPRYVPRGSALQLDAWTVEKQPVEVTVDLLYIDPVTEKPTGYADRVPVVIPPKGGPPPKPVPLTDHGFASYLRLSTKDAGIHVNGIRIVRAK